MLAVLATAVLLAVLLLLRLAVLLLLLLAAVACGMARSSLVHGSTRLPERGREPPCVQPSRLSMAPTATQV
jgi:hypothetical protein